MYCVTHPEGRFIPHGFFGRTGGISTGPLASLNGDRKNDDLPRVVENRRRAAVCLQETFCLSTLYPAVFLRQEHTACAVVLEHPQQDLSQPADGVVTRCRGVFLGLTTADCAPVFLYDEEAGVIGAAHAGWRGAFGGVLEATLEAMNGLGSSSKTRVAIIGPTIQATHYEVGEAFYETCLQNSPESNPFFRPPQGNKSFLFDLPGYVAHRLRPHVREVYDVGQDTVESPFFSCRRSALLGEADFGRNISLMALPEISYQVS